MRTLLALAIILIVTPANPQEKQDSVEKKVLALLERLRSDDIEGRQVAVKELLAIGDPALGLLERAAMSADAEFAARVKAVLRQMGRKAPGPMRNPADRLKFRIKRLDEAQGGKAVEEAILSALAWLARHQEVDGGWSNDMIGAKFAADPCAAAGAGNVSNDDGVTALAVLAFLGAGYWPASKEELADPADPRKKWKPGEIVKKGLDRLRAAQRKDGAVLGGGKGMYAHAAATMAFCEAAAMTGSAADTDAAKKAVEYLLDARNPGAAWRYKHRSGDNDTSVTGWCVAALHAARTAGLWKPEVPVQAGVVAWLDGVTTVPDCRAGYNGIGSGKLFVPGKNQNHLHHETMTAISVLARRHLLGEDEDAAKRDNGIALLMGDPPDAGPKSIDTYYWFWGSLAIHQIDGAAGPKWLHWYELATKALIPLQLAKGCQHGSWDSDGDRWGFEGGRAGVTALNALTLLTPVR